MQAGVQVSQLVERLGSGLQDGTPGQAGLFGMHDSDGSEAYRYIVSQARKDVEEEWPMNSSRGGTAAPKTVPRDRINSVCDLPSDSTAPSK